MVDMLIISSNGIDRYSPLSKLPSPYSALLAVVMVAQAPTRTPLKNSREMSTVVPQSPAR